MIPGATTAALKLAGQACIDRRFGGMNAIEDVGYGAGNWDLHRAAEMLKQTGVPVTEDAGDEEFGTAPAPSRCDGAIFYAGWYSLNHYNDAFSWRPARSACTLIALRPRALEYLKDYKERTETS